MRAPVPVSSWADTAQYKEPLKFKDAAAPAGTSSPTSSLSHLGLDSIVLFSSEPFHRKLQKQKRSLCILTDLTPQTPVTFLQFANDFCLSVFSFVFNSWVAKYQAFL